MFSSTLFYGLDSEIVKKGVQVRDLHSAQVVRVGHEKVFLAFRQELVENTRLVKSIVQVTVTRGVPVLLVIICGLGAWEEGLLIDTGVSRLVESGDTELLVSVLLDDTEGVLVGIEGRHQDKRDVNTAGSVEMFDLAHSEVEEGHVIFDFKRTLGTSHT